MPARTFILIPVIVIVLSGCGVIQAQKNAVIVQQNKQSQDALTADYTSKLQTAELDPIRDKVELSRTLTDPPPPFAMLTNNTVPTSAEVAAISKWAEIRDRSLKKFHELMYSEPLPSNVSPVLRNRYMSFSEQATQGVTFLITALYNKQITYGEFARKRSELDQQTNTAMRDWLLAMDIQDQQRRLQQAQLAEQQYANFLQAWRSFTPVTCTTTGGRSFAQTTCN